MSDATPKPPRKGGRKPGQVNKFSADVKARILAALEIVGGEKYLAEQAKKNPAAFMSLLGKVMPLQVKADVGEFRYVVQKLVVSSDPVPGVISTGVQPLRLVGQEESAGNG